MTIIRDAVTLRLKNPLIQYEPYTAKGFNGTLTTTNFAGMTGQATRIIPNTASFTSVGTVWYDVTPGSGGNAELILASGMSSILTQPGVVAADRVEMGRWAITELRLVEGLPVLDTVGRIVAYDFEVMCYVPFGATGNPLRLGQETFRLTFPIEGVAMQSVIGSGALATQNLISPYNFVRRIEGNVEGIAPVSAMTDIRAWVFGRGSTFNLANWDLGSPTTAPAPLAVRDSWRRAFLNHAQYVMETSIGSLPLGHRLSAGGGQGDDQGTRYGAWPYFINITARDTSSVTNILMAMAAYFNQGPLQLGVTEDIIFHAAPSPALPTGGGDTFPPTVAITNPASNGTTVSSASLNVAGTASDNVGVTLVQVRLNGGAWFNASGTGNWSIGLFLSSGLNTIEAQARDAAGNLSSIAVRQITFQATPTSFTVTPSADPNGAISPNTPRIVSPGGTVNFLAIPATGYVVDQWFLDGQPAGALSVGQDSYSLVNVRADHSVRVTFKLIPFPRVTFAPGSIISIQALVNTKLVTAEAGGEQPLIANRTFLGDWERFEIFDMGNGTFALKSLSNGKFVAAENAGTAPLIANRPTAGTWEQFRAVDFGKGLFGLIANVNEKYVCAESAGNGSLIANRSVVGGWEQFRIVYPASVQPVTVIASLQAPVTGSYVSAESAGAGALIANRPLLGAWEQLQFVDVGNGNVAIKARINNRFITAENAGTSPLIANRTVIGGWEQFQLVDAGAGYVALKALANGQYVSSNTAGGVLLAKSYFVGATERFALNVVLTSQANGSFVCAENGGNSPLIANRTTIGGWEQFQFVNINNGYIALKSLANGRYVCAENAGVSPLIANRNVIGGWEQFQWVVGGNGNIALKALTNGRFVTAENGGRDPLIANRTSALSWEQFR